MSDPAEIRHVIEVRSNASLTPGHAVAFFAGTVAASLIIALFWAAQGYWPILPFAGLEMLAFGLGLAWSVRRSRHRERITIGEAEVSIERGSDADAAQERLSRHWARVELVAPAHPWYPSRLYLSSHGRRHEIGATLVERERRSLARRLGELLRPAGA